MDIDMNKEHWEHGKCPKYDCRKDACKCGLRKVFLASVLGDDSKDSPIAPKNGAYCDAIVVYEANGHIYIYSKEGIPTLVNSESGGDYEELQSEIEKEILDRIAGDKVLQDEIDEIKNSPDVVDIVATYAALQAYDTSKLGNNDIIRVLADETHDGQSTYYRWNKQSSTWTYIGAVGDYYTKGQVDTLLADKQDKLTAGSNISITQVDDDLVISATDTTYTAGEGIDITSGVISVDTDDIQEKVFTVLTVADYDENNRIDITPLDAGWYLIKAGCEIYFNDYYTWELDCDNLIYKRINDQQLEDPTQIDYDVILYSVGINLYSVSGDVGNEPDVYEQYFVTTEVTNNIVEQLHNAVLRGGTTPTTATEGKIGTLYETTDNGKLYICTAIDSTDPSDIQYTWTEVGAGGGGPTVVQTTGTSTTDVMSQDAVTKMINPDITNHPYKVIINSGTIASNTGLAINGEINNAQSTNSIAINAGGTTPAVIGSSGYAAESIAIGPTATVAKGYASVAIGGNAYVNTPNAYLTGIAIGMGSYCNGNESLAIGDSARTNSQNDVALGKSTNTLGTYSTAIGSNARARSERSLALGASAEVDNSPAMAYSVALGANSKTTRAGEVNIGTGASSHGYNSTSYRVIGGVHDGQDIHDAATVAQGNTLSTSAPDSSTVGVLGQLWTDTTNMHTYQCTAISGSTYTWQMRW